LATFGRENIFKMIVVICKLSLLVVVVNASFPMTMTMKHTAGSVPAFMAYPSIPEDLRRDTSHEPFFNSFPFRSNRELIPITFLDLWQYGNLRRIATEVFSIDEIIRINQYLITHPVVNRKLLQFYLNLRLRKDRHVLKVLAAQKTIQRNATILTMIEYVTKENLRFVDILFEELAEQLPLIKKKRLKNKLVAKIDETKEEMLGSETLDLANSYPRFINEFFATSNIGLGYKDSLEVQKNLQENPTFEHVKKKIYHQILDDRLYFDNLLQKIGIKGLRKQENRRKLKQHRIKTIKSISKALLDPGLQPSMKKYAIKIQKHVSQNVN